MLKIMVGLAVRMMLNYLIKNDCEVNENEAIEFLVSFLIILITFKNKLLIYLLISYLMLKWDYRR